MLRVPNWETDQPLARGAHEIATGINALIKLIGDVRQPIRTGNLRIELGRLRGHDEPAARRFPPPRERAKVQRPQFLAVKLSRSKGWRIALLTWPRRQPPPHRPG
jgi:hypothetical protein